MAYTTATITETQIMKRGFIRFTVQYTGAASPAITINYEVEGAKIVADADHLTTVAVKTITELNALRTYFIAHPKDTVLV